MFKHTYGMRYLQYPRSIAILLFFALSLQSCRPSLQAIIEESNAGNAHKASNHAHDAGESRIVALCSQFPGFSAEGSGVLDRVLLGAPTSADTQALGGAILAGSGLDAQFPPRLLRASSGEHVLLKREGTGWKAVLQRGMGSCAHGRTVPVVGSGDMDALLASLQGSDVWLSSARVHVMTSPYPPYSPCVYLGKVGLLGGLPTQQAPLSSEGAWCPGPCITLGSNETCTKVYHIPPGYRYHGFRFKREEVEGASYTIRYVAAKSKEEIDVLADVKSDLLLGARLMADFEISVTLGRLEVGGYKMHFNAHQNLSDLSDSSFEHEALVVHGSTKSAGSSSRKSCIDIQLEVCVVKDGTPTSSFALLPSPFDAVPASSSPGSDQGLLAASTPVLSQDTPFSEKKLTSPECVLEDSQAAGPVELKKEPFIFPEAQGSERKARLLEHDARGRSVLHAKVIRRQAGYGQPANLVVEEQACSEREHQEKPAVPGHKKVSFNLECGTVLAQQQEAQGKFQWGIKGEMAQNHEVEKLNSANAATDVEEQEWRRHFGHDVLLAQQQKAQRNKLAMRGCFAQPEAQGEERAGLSEVSITPAMAFGAREWRRYFGEVGEEPPLPVSIGRILKSPCPFWPGEQIKDTHLLVLLPATVDGQPFTLNLLGNLIQDPQGGGHDTKYVYYNSTVQSTLGDRPVDRSYWVLVTRDVLPGSRNGLYADQKILVSTHTHRRLGLFYELPRALEVVTAILSHHVHTGGRLYTNSPSTYTRCQEEVGKDSYPVVVGGFSTRGLGVSYDCDDDVRSNGKGVSCLLRF